MSTDNNIYQNLRNRLVSGGFEPGQRLRSEDLGKDYDVSASSIRELLFRLSTVGLVDFQEQRGFRMPQQSSELLHDLTQTRMMLECEGACRSIRHGGVAWEARLIAVHHELKHIEGRMHVCEQDSGLFSLWCGAELKYHSTLIEECRSEILKDFHLQVFYRFRQQLVSSREHFGFIPENVEQHQSILDAVLRRDEDLVRQRIHDHLSRNLAEPLAKKAVPTGG